MSPQVVSIRTEPDWLTDLQRLTARAHAGEVIGLYCIEVLADGTFAYRRLGNAPADPLLDSITAPPLP